MPFEDSDKDQSEAIAQLKSRLSGFETEKGRLYGLSYIPKRPDEVVITTTPKAGTTWVQQICHQLRSASDGGDMTFSEISEVVPWLELAYDQGQQLESAQYGDDHNLPRFFKSHAWEEHCPDFPKVIVVLRNPEDVVQSFYRFFEGWFFEPGTLSMDAFAQEFWLARGVPQSRMQNASYFVHLTSWFKRKDDPNVLFLFFEDLLEDLESQVQRIAKFVSTENHNFDMPDIVKSVTEKSTYAFMKAHESQFDEKLSKLSRNEACGLPKDAGMTKSKIVRGESGLGNKNLSDDLKNGIWQKWREVVEPVTGCSNYEVLRKKFKE